MNDRQLEAGRTKKQRIAPAVVVGALALFALQGGCGGAPEPVVTPPAPTAAPEAAPTAAAAVAAVPTAAPTVAPTAAPAAPAAPPHWTYEGAEGPSHWSELSPDFALCKTGSKQTPIDLPLKASANDKTLSSIAFDYRPVPLDVINNGHTVEVESTVPNAITVGKDRYDLVQFHVHTPSEHTIGGKAFDMELHLVHKNAAGNLAVVGILFKKGKESATLKPIWDHLPTVAGPRQDVEGVKVDLGPLLPKKAGYWSYEGSLTTPRCSEGVRWFVLDATSEASAAQIDALKAAVHGSNARPLQDLGGRVVAHFKP